MKAYILFILLVVLLASPVSAHAKTSVDGYSSTQVDGITDTVVDRLWSRTDFWWHHGDYLRMIALDRIITEADPQFLEPYSTGGWLMESLGRDSDAEKYYRLGATRNPTKSYLWFSLGFFYFNTLKDYPKAITNFDLAATRPDAGPQCWKMLAHAYEKNKQLKEATDIWERLHTKYPTDGVITHNLIKDQNLLKLQSAPPVN